ncbi:MAG: FecR family protein, partial [Gammaproteobacteria bacterium]|nr:FecR family protein [Gammaproteobacteria bacterium]
MLRTTHRLCAGSGLATVVLFCSTVWGEVEITHRPLEEVKAGARIALQAEVEDEETGVELVRAYFRAGDGADYVYTAMTPAGDDANVYTATLPAPAQNAGRLDYFLLVRSGDGNVVKSQNFTADVTPDEDTAAALAALPARTVIVQPSEFAAIDGYHGKLVKLVGEVQVVRADGTVRSAADVGYVVREAETVRTGADGRVVVDFDGDPITVLDATSRLNVKAPSWLTHLAGKAYFAFKRLLDVGQRERTVASTVALIGIRGTDVMSYASQGVGVKEGNVDIGSPRGDVLEVASNGTTETTQTFVLEAERFASFDGTRVTVSDLPAPVRADFEDLKAFSQAGPVDTLSAEAQITPSVSEPVTVFSEQTRMASRVPGSDDYIYLVQIGERLGLAAASTTVAASAGGIGATGAILGGLTVAALAGSSSSSGGSGGNDGNGDTPPDTSPPPDTGPVFGSDFVGVTLNFTGIDGEPLCLEVIDPCGQTVSETIRSVTCGTFTGDYSVVS